MVADIIHQTLDDQQAHNEADHAADSQYADWMAAFCQRKYNSDFAREMSRSVAEYLRQYLPE